MSQFEGILDALENITISYTNVEGAVVTLDSDSVRNIDELLGDMKDADLPLRQFGVPGPSSSRSDETAFIALGKMQSIRWTISDRFYLRPVQTGEGLRKASGDLYRYIAAYTEQIRQNRSPTSQSHIEGVSCRADILFWPDDPDVGTPYFGVDCEVRIQEIVSGA